MPRRTSFARLSPLSRIPATVHCDERGLNEPRSIKRLASSTEILVSLRAFPDRPLIVQVFRAGDRCVARTITKIQQQSALLQSIYIDLGFLFTVNYAQLTGVRLQDGQRVQEKLHE